MSFCRQRHVAIQILSANGVTSRATINRPQASGTFYTYEVKHLCYNLIVVIVSIFLNSMNLYGVQVKFVIHMQFLCVSFNNAN